jgi:LmbE family N-acetylglucosaminyl deacetylase
VALELQLERLMTRVLVIAAHPGDETIGAAALLTSLEDCAVLHLTDGVPRDRAFWSPHAPRSPGSYQVQRRAEALAAMALVGVTGPDIHRFGQTDLELADMLPDLARELAHFLAALSPELVVTHAYEGGHPDHDAAAFATWAARQLLSESGLAVPVQLEMALYHSAPGYMVMGQFVACDTVATPQIQCAFQHESLARKHAMLRCYESQRDDLRPFFALTRERFRPAPRYDFAAPPHFGALQYERQGLPVPGELWRERAAHAVKELCLGRPSVMSPVARL